jgi:replicative DNA helicase
MYDNDTIIVDYVEMLRTNGNYERRIEELNEAIRRLNEELHRVTYINIDYTIQPNGSR